MNKKNLVIYLITGLVIVGVGLISGGKVFLPNFSSQEGKNKPPLKSVERNLSKEEIAIYEKRLKEGQKALEEVNSNSPDYSKDKAGRYIYLAQIYYGLGELAKSENNYNFALELTPNNPNIWTGLYLTRLEGGDFSGARDAIQKARELSPQDPDIWKKLIELRREKFGSDFPDQRGLFNDALVATNFHQDIYVAYAQYLESQGKLKEALEQWQAVVKSYPGNASYKEELQRIEAMVKN